MSSMAPKSGGSITAATAQTPFPLQQQIAGTSPDKLRSKLSSSEKQQVTKEDTQNPEPTSCI